MKVLALWRRWFPRPLETGALAERGQVRMLELTHQRLAQGIFAMPLLGVLFTMWFQGLGRNPLGMLAWTVLYTLAAGGVFVQSRQLRASRSGTAPPDDAAWLRRWRPRVRATSWGQALGLASLGAIVVLTPGRASFDFVLLLHVSLAVVIVGTATFQLPSLGTFLRFYGFGWGVVSVLVPLSLSQWPNLFGNQAMPDGPPASPWRFIIPMSLLLMAALYRHAVVAHNFFLQQVRLEEESLRLAQEAQQAHAEAEQALRAKNLFLSTASHDLRQPIHAMGFQIEALARRNHDATLLPALDDMRRSLRSVSLMFNALLDLSRIESGTLQARRQPVALRPLLHDVALLFRAEARDLGLVLREHLPPEDATVLADPVLLRQCVINLVHNALRYTRHGGVLLAARRRGAQWRIAVWDTGVGVAEQDHQRIYQPYERLQRSTLQADAGHGLGLAVVARCTELMAAEHGLRSRLGRGSCFWLQLAATAAVLPPSGHATHAGQGTGSASTTAPPPLLTLRGTCLVLDDDPQVQQAWHNLLCSWGLQVRLAANAQEALAAAARAPAPDVVLCDQRLRTGESGFDVLRTLLARHPGARGAMVSGEFDAPALQEAEAEGYVVLRKPVDVGELHTLLTRWLDSEVPMVQR